MDYAKQTTRAVQMPNGSSSKEKADHAVDQAVMTICELIGRFNDPKRHDLLMGYFKPSHDLRQLEASLSKAEADLDAAMTRLREELLQLKMLREAVDFLTSQNSPSHGG